MQSGRSHGPLGDNGKREILRRHGPALVLWAALLATFLLVVSLYVTFSEPYLLRVYEIMQIHRAQIEGRSVNQAIIDYEDYLRVDPESIRVRGLLVNAFIEKQEFEEAEVHARNALNRSTKEQRPLSWLIAARVYLAKSDIDKAVPYIQGVLDATPKSGEGHYQMGQIHLARGEFEKAEQEFAWVRMLGPKDSTREYLEDWNTRSKMLEEYQREIEAGVDSAQRLYELGTEFQKMGRLDQARELYSKAGHSKDFSRVSTGVLDVAAFEFEGLYSVYVDFSFGGVELGTPENPYNTLGEALDAGGEGAKINLAVGSSAELLTINQNVTLQSTDGSVRIGSRR